MEYQITTIPNETFDYNVNRKWTTRIKIMKKNERHWLLCFVVCYVSYKMLSSHFISANVHQKGKQMGANHFYWDLLSGETVVVPNGQINLMNQYLSKNCNHLFTLTWMEYYRVLSVDLTHSKWSQLEREREEEEEKKKRHWGRKTWIEANIRIHTIERKSFVGSRLC